MPVDVAVGKRKWVLAPLRRGEMRCCFYGHFGGMRQAVSAQMVQRADGFVPQALVDPAHSFAKKSSFDEIASDVNQYVGKRRDG